VTLAPDGLARLVSAALPDEGLTASDLETCCYGPDSAKTVTAPRHLHPGASRTGSTRSNALLPPAPCYAARGGGGTIGFACHSVNRTGWIGPMATDPGRQHAGVGRSLLGEVCASLSDAGHTEADIAWVGPIGFYAKAGAVVSRVFRNAKLAL